MTNKTTITKIIDADVTNSMGEKGQRVRDVSIDYTKGRGIMLSVYTKTRTKSTYGVCESLNIFGDGNMSLCIEPLRRIKPTLLKQYGEQLKAYESVIHAAMDQWDNDDLWSTERRKTVFHALGWCMRGDKPFTTLDEAVRNTAAAHEIAAE